MKNKLLLRTFILCCVMCLMAIASNAQWAPVSTVFKNWLVSKHNVPTSVFMQSGTWFMDTTSVYITNDTLIGFDPTPFSGDHITDIEGIQYFDNLRHLSGRNQGLDSVPPLPGTLTYLYIPVNSFRSLPYLPNSIQTLSFFNCANLKQVTNLPTSLTSLSAYSCAHLSSLPPPSNLLKVFSCYSDSLTSLPTLPDSMTTIYCYNNHLSSLPTLPISLSVLNCNNNQITTLPALPASLTQLFCQNNQLTSLPDLPDSLGTLDVSDNLNLACFPELNIVTNLGFMGTSITCVPNYPLDNVGSYPSLVGFPICDSLPFNPCAGLAFPPAQSICVVTTDSNSTHTIVEWEKTNREATDSFHIYREISTNIYAIVGAVDGDSLSEFHDYSANPNATDYRYKISVLDTNGFEGNTSTYHNTIHLQSFGGGNMQWTEYLIDGISPVTTYDVYYDTAANGNWQLMLSLSNSHTTATDVNYSNHPLALYRLVANVPFSCTPARSSTSAIFSNIIHFQTSGIHNNTGDTYFSLYPNPASTSITISIDESMIGSTLSITDITGKQMAAQKIIVANQKLNISNFSNGVYFVTLESEKGRSTKKLIIQK